MLAIDQVLISDDIVEQKFVCDLSACHGGCCVDGDAGAPLERGELRWLEKVYPVVRKYLSARANQEIARQGKYVYDGEFG